MFVRDFSIKKCAGMSFVSAKLVIAVISESIIEKVSSKDWVDVLLSLFRMVWSCLEDMGVISLYMDIRQINVVLPIHVPFAA